MKAIERTLAERQGFVRAKLGAGAQPPTPPQLASFLRALVAQLRPHTASECSQPPARRPLGRAADRLRCRSDSGPGGADAARMLRDGTLGCRRQRPRARQRPVHAR